MEAIERTFLSNDWITFMFLFGLLLLFFMKSIKPNRLIGYSGAFFIQGFIQERAEKKTDFFTPFYIAIFSFSVLIISLSCFFIIPKAFLAKTFLGFLTISLFVIAYLSIKFLINFTIIKVLNIEIETRYFFISCIGYLYTTALLIFPLLIINQYGFKNNLFLLIFILFILLIRFVLILLNNKKLIFSQLFYFILYFCTLELAPLLILYKTTTT